MKDTRRIPVAVLSLLLTAGTALAGSTFRLQQAGNPAVDTEVTAFEADAHSIADFYNYDGGSRAGFWGIEDILSNGDLTPGQSHLFLVEASDGLGLFVVHNAMVDGGWTQKYTAEMLLTFDSEISAAALVVEDDDGDRAYNDDEYDTVTNDASSIKAQWEWADTYTDGLAVRWKPTGENPSVDVAFADVTGAEFKEYSVLPTGYTWAFLSKNSGTPITLDLQQDTPVTLTMLPLPPTAWPVVGMLAVIGLKKWRSRGRELTSTAA